MKNVLLSITAILVCFSLTGCTEELENITYPYPDSKEILVTLEEFNEIQTGMTEQEVWDIIGGQCTNTGTTDVGIGEKYVTVTYGCNGDGKTGANVILMFQGQKLTSKTQVGLK